MKDCAVAGICVSSDKSGILPYRQNINDECYPTPHAKEQISPIIHDSLLESRYKLPPEKQIFSNDNNSKDSSVQLLDETKIGVDHRNLSVANKYNQEYIADQYFPSENFSPNREAVVTSHPDYSPSTASYTQSQTFSPMDYTTTSYVRSHSKSQLAQQRESFL